MFKVVPPSVRAAHLANPFMVPDFTDAEQRKSTERRLVGWELITPLLNSFEQAPTGAPACMALPDPYTPLSHRGQELVDPHSRRPASVPHGHRTLLLPAAPGLAQTPHARPRAHQ